MFYGNCLVTAYYLFRNQCYSSSFPGMLCAPRFELRFEPMILTVSVSFTGLRKKNLLVYFSCTNCRTFSVQECQSQDQLDIYIKDFECFSDRKCICNRMYLSWLISLEKLRLLLLVLYFLSRPYFLKITQVLQPKVFLILQFKLRLFSFQYCWKVLSCVFIKD